MIERAYAKINLALEVLPARSDGYHEVVNIMVPIDLYDELEFIATEADIIMESDIDIKDNVVLKAAKLFMDTYHIKKGVIIRLKKKIPLSAGLAGGSSDAAATLRGLNRLFKVNASLDELAILSAKLGSDMPYCVYSEPAICYGRGEVVKKIENVEFLPIPLTLLCFPFGLSTKAVYKEYKYQTKDRSQAIAAILKGLQHGNRSLIETSLFNDLAKPALALSPRLEEMLLKIKTLGYLPFQSGSGPTHYLFGHGMKNLLLKAEPNLIIFEIFILPTTAKIK